MAGQPGRSGGHNRSPIEEHVRRGTYNPTRHGPRPALVVRSTRTAPAPRAHIPAEPVPDDVVTGLSGRGLRPVTEIYQTYANWTPQSLELLREAGFLLTQLETLRGLPGERAAQKHLLAVLAAMRLED